MNQLRELRKKARLSQIQLSQTANVSRFRLSLAENLAIRLRPAEVEAIRRAIKAEMSQRASDLRELL